MYVASFTKKRLMWHASVINKIWSENMFSYQVSCVQKKDFLLLCNAKRWAKNEVLRNMIERKELEFTDG
jgi:hypothetical protein